ncbi:MAG: hypothetical protein HC852_07135 [Acaryochloridaceae cyanobacterium RU_4_10]|nr:hypothetical protein [Acaryochloridaceae cyanobacterium RU_4_10]
MPVLRFFLGLLALSPTFLAFIYAGNMLGKPQDCSKYCSAPTFGDEVFILPLLSLAPFPLGYVLGATRTRKKEAKSAPQRESVGVEG